MRRKQRVLITRPASQTTALCAELSGRDCIGVPLPLTAIDAYHDPAHEQVWHELASYDRIVFTSANGVAHAWAQAAACHDTDAILRRHAGIAVVGPATARAVTVRGGTVHTMAPVHVAESLADTLGDVTGMRVLWLRGWTARDVLPQTLRGRGARVDEVIVYQSVPAPLPADAAERVRNTDIATFASPSAVRRFVECFGAGGNHRVVCIGPITAAAAGTVGLHVDAIAESYTATGLIDAITRFHV